MPTVALVGRTNVGKSSLFNVLATSKLRAIASNAPELTRDCNFSPARIGDVYFTVVDTPGIDSIELAPSFMQRALLDSSLVCFVVDGRSGVTSVDLSIAKGLRKLNKPVLLIVNKCEFLPALGSDYYKLWGSSPVCISASHKQGIEELGLGLIACGICTSTEAEGESLKIALIGRPNVGKSTLINSLLGFSRLRVSSEPGTTRDAISTELSYKTQKLALIDTAGLRKKGRIGSSGIETLCVASTLKAIGAADVAILIIECSSGLNKQDIEILQVARTKRKCFVVAVNKLDLVPKAGIKRLKEELNAQIARITDAPVVYISALSKPSSVKVLDACLNVYDSSGLAISTGRLNAWLKLATGGSVRPKSASGRPFKARYCVCIARRPFLIKIFCNWLEPVSASYKRYLANSFKKHFSIHGSDVKFIFCGAGRH